MCVQHIHEHHNNNYNGYSTCYSVYSNILFEKYVVAIMLKQISIHFIIIISTVQQRYGSSQDTLPGLITHLVWLYPVPYTSITICRCSSHCIPIAMQLSHFLPRIIFLCSFFSYIVQAIDQRVQQLIWISCLNHLCLICATTDDASCSWLILKAILKPSLLVNVFLHMSSCQLHEMLGYSFSYSFKTI